MLAGRTCLVTCMGVSGSTRPKLASPRQLLGLKYCGHEHEWHAALHQAVQQMCITVQVSEWYCKISEL